jgi:hypothetical protein
MHRRAINEQQERVTCLTLLLFYSDMARLSPDLPIDHEDFACSNCAFMKLYVNLRFELQSFKETFACM